MAGLSQLPKQKLIWRDQSEEKETRRNISLGNGNGVITVGAPRVPDNQLRTHFIEIGFIQTTVLLAYVIKPAVSVHRKLKHTEG